MVLNLCECRTRLPGPFCRVPRFYFDVRDGGEFVEDTEGTEFAGLKEAREDASRALAQMLKDAMPDGMHHDVSVEVRDEKKRPLFKVQITFEVQAVGSVLPT
jgi:hypothetical protein